MNTLIDGIFSRNDTTIMLVSILSLLLVLLFVISLHFYARWFLHQDRSNAISSPSILVVPPGLWARPFRHLHDFLTIDITNGHDFSIPIYGLDPSTISSIPQFVLKENEIIMEGVDHRLGCVICLSLIENGQKGKKLTLCHHAFHVECIDMWLRSHATCPICRAPAVKICNSIVLGSSSMDYVNEEAYEELMESSSREDHRSRLEIIVEVQNTVSEIK